MSSYPPSRRTSGQSDIGADDAERISVSVVWHDRGVTLTPLKWQRFAQAVQKSKPSSMRRNKRISFARYACSTRNGEAP